MAGHHLAALALLATLAAAGCSEQGAGTGEQVVDIRPNVCANPEIWIDGRVWLSDGLAPWREPITGSFRWSGTRGTFTGPDGQSLDYDLSQARFSDLNCVIG